MALSLRPTLIVLEEATQHLYPIEAVSSFGDDGAVTVQWQSGRETREFPARLSEDGQHAISGNTYTTYVMEYGERHRVVMLSGRDNGGYFHLKDGETRLNGGLFKDSGNLKVNESLKGLPFDYLSLQSYRHMSHWYLRGEMQPEGAEVMKSNVLQRRLGGAPEDPLAVIQFAEGRPSLLSVEWDDEKEAIRSTYTGHVEFAGRLYPEFIYREVEDKQTGVTRREDARVIAWRELTVEEFDQYFTAENSTMPPVDLGE